MTSPTQLHTDSSETSSEPPSNEHTPTTFGAGFDDGIRPRTVITEWLPEECAQFIASLDLRQYSDAFIGKNYKVMLGAGTKQLQNTVSTARR